MRNSIKVAGLLSLSVGTLFAAGYKIPEQSLNSTALSAAYVANARGADSSYYNPANMAFSDDGAQMEIALTYIGLSKIKYTDTLPAIYGLNTESKSEQFLVPTFHYISPVMNNWRFGLSLVAPGGLSKRWENAYQKAYAQEFTLKIFELNPTASYKVNDKFAVGFGLRGVYTDGVVRSNGAVSRDMSGDSIDFGYNLALSYLPTKNMTVSATYRSKVDLTVSGDADLYSGATKVFSNLGTKVTIPLPAALNIAAAYTYKKTTLELVYERTYWSSYKYLDFNYNQNIGGLAPYFDAPIPKNWKDTNTYRIGVTHQYNDKLKLMAGFAIDKSPIRDGYVGFELPDSDAKLYSAGFEYKINDNIKVGLAYLYDSKESRSVSQRTTPANPATGISGAFTNTSASLVTASFKYRF